MVVHHEVDILGHKNAVQIEFFVAQRSMSILCPIPSYSLGDLHTLFVRNQTKEIDGLAYSTLEDFGELRDEVRAREDTHVRKQPLMKGSKVLPEEMF